MAKTLIVGSDHAGLGLKRELLGVAAESGYEVVDLGQIFLCQCQCQCQCQRQRCWRGMLA